VLPQRVAWTLSKELTHGQKGQGCERKKSTLARARACGYCLFLALNIVVGAKSYPQVHSALYTPRKPLAFGPPFGPKQAVRPEPARAGSASFIATLWEICHNHGFP
jgi:hypothetical protein